MQWGADRRQPALGQCFEQQRVTALDQIVASLIHAIDSTLHIGDLVIGCVRRARFVFKVPQFEVGLMMGDDGCGEIFGGQGLGVLAVPLLDQFVMECSDGAGVEQSVWRMGHAVAFIVVGNGHATRYS